MSVKRSATMELGQAIVAAAKRPWIGGPRLPRHLYRMWRERRAGQAAWVPADGFRSADEERWAHILLDAGAGAAGDRFLAAYTVPGLAWAAAAGPGSEGQDTADGLVVAGVLTDASCAALAPDATTEQLLPHDAAFVLEGSGADLVLIEAAALLPGGAWAHAGDPAAADRGRRLADLIDLARALGKPVIFLRNAPSYLLPYLDWLGEACDAVADGDLGVQLAQFNPVDLPSARQPVPVYAGQRDPREGPATKRLLDELTSGAADGAVPVRVIGAPSWRAAPALYREHSVFLAATAAQAREQLACGARVVGPVTEDADVSGATAVGSPEQAARQIAAARSAGPRSMTEVKATLHELFETQAIPARLAALGQQVGLPPRPLPGRRVAVLAGVRDAASAAQLAGQVLGQRLRPHEVLVWLERRAGGSRAAERSGGDGRTGPDRRRAGPAQRGRHHHQRGQRHGPGRRGPRSRLTLGGRMGSSAGVSPVGLAGADVRAGMLPGRCGRLRPRAGLRVHRRGRSSRDPDRTAAGGRAAPVRPGPGAACGCSRSLAQGSPPRDPTNRRGRHRDVRTAGRIRARAPPPSDARAPGDGQAAAARSRSALVYGDVNLNLIDGSAIWVQSMVLALARAGCAVTLVVKAPVQTDRLLAPLQGEPGVTIRRPAEEQLLEPIGANGLTPGQASQVLTAVDAEHRHDIVVLRGRRLVDQVVQDNHFRGRLWTYLTDIPQSIPAMTTEAVRWLADVADASQYVLCQTEELRCFLEGSVAAACGKCVLFPPVVPPPPEFTGARAGAPREPEGVLRLVYTGKFAPRWNTYEMTQLPGLLAKRGVRAELHMVGDKIHNDPDDPGYHRRMRAALGDPPTPGAGGPDDTPQAVPATGVVWRGGHSREDAMRIAAACDIGLGWRHPSLDASLELSTKVLEFGMLGLPVILNRTPMHEALLGADYPMFARDLRDVVAIAETAAADPAIMKVAASRTSAAAAEYTLDKAVGRIRRYLDDAPARVEVSPGTATLKVAVAGHDLKFFAPLLEYLRQQPGLEVRIDRWPSLGEHDEAASEEISRWADVVICEWCGPNAIWYSENKRPGSRLIVRLHRFEVYARYPYRVKIKAVDQVVTVDKYYAELTAEKTGWPASKIVALPNTVQVGQLDRPKLDGARFNLGMVGIVPSRKRVDLALDVLAELRRDDERYMLYVKSGMPWDHWWIWQKPEERGHYAAALHRIQRSPLLRGAVVFDEAGPDVPAWLRRVGFVLSTSDDESFHVAPAEGMASGAVPVIRHWPGAETVYDTRWIHETPQQMAAAIAAIQTEEQWREAGALAKAQGVAEFDSRKVFGTWYRLLTENLTPATKVQRYSLPGAP